MSDFSRFLPLSQRARGSEDDVSSDRRAALADVIEQAAVLVATIGEGHPAFAQAFIEVAELRLDYDALDSAGNVTDDDGHIGSIASPVSLFDLARLVRSGRRRSIRTLEAGCRALLLLGRELDTPVGLDPNTAGAVTLHLSGAGPFDRRAVIKGHTVRATDAEWSFGHGPVLEGTSTAIAAFLLGTSNEPPRPPAAPARG